MNDSTLIGPITTLVTTFGVPVAWFTGGVVAVQSLVNYIKVLAPNWIGGGMYPYIAGAACATYSFMTLLPTSDVWHALLGAAGLFVVQWLGWIAIKRGATKIGARNG